MDFYSILNEARTPSNKYKHASPRSTMKILVEAEKDETKPEEDDAKDETNAEDNNQNEDTNDTDNNPEEDGGTDVDIDDVGDDSTGTDDEPQDGDVADDGSQTPEDEIDPTRVKNKVLLNNTIDLYYSSKKAITKLDTINGFNTDVDKVILTVKNNFITLTDLLFIFITDTFKKNTYVKNLYTFNYFIQTYSTNIDILEKIDAF